MGWPRPILLVSPSRDAWRKVYLHGEQTDFLFSLFISLLFPLSLLLFLMLSRSLFLSLLKMTCNLSQADKRMRRAILRSSHKSAVIHILLLFSSPLISSPFFSSSLCSFPSFGFDSGCKEMKETYKLHIKHHKQSLTFLSCQMSFPVSLSICLAC